MGKKTLPFTYKKKQLVIATVISQNLLHYWTLGKLEEICLQVYKSLLNRS